MSKTLPGSRLHRLLASCVDRDTFARLIEPTIADLQHEASAAPTRWSRASAILGGYSAIARVLVVCEISATMAWVRAGVILTLGAIGAALENRAFASAMDGRVVNSALLLPTFAAPFVFRLLDKGSGYWRLFLTSAAAGILPWVAAEVSISMVYPTAFVWHVARLANGCVFTAIASALGAAAVWNPVDAAAPFPRRTVTGLWYASLATTAVFLASSLMQSVYTLPFATLRAPFFIMLFAMILAVTSLPVLLLARRWIRRRAWLAFLAVACCPLPIVAGAVVDGRNVAQVLIDCYTGPVTAARSLLPYIVGMATLGWLLGARREPTSPDMVTT